MNRTIASFIAVLMILTGIAIAAGAPGGATPTQVGASERGTGTASGQANITGGNVTAVNVSGNQITGRWGGFYGNVSGGIQLADSSSNLFYEWTVTDYTGAYVYAANGTVTDWTGGNIVAATIANQPGLVKGAAADNYTNTFTNSGAFTSASLSVGAADYAQTFNSTGSGTFSTYALRSASDGVNIYAGQAINNGNGFNGKTVDYQILAPAGTGTTTYQFYLELP